MFKHAAIFGFTLLLTVLFAACIRPVTEETTTAIATPTTVDGSVQTTAPTVTAILSVTWQLQAIQYMNDTVKTPTDPTHYTLTLNPDHSFTAKVDCNNARGAYQLDGSQLKLGPLMMTRMACPPDSLADAYQQGLTDATSFVLKGGELFVAFGPDAGILHFVSNAAPAGAVNETMSVTDTTAMTNTTPMTGTAPVSGTTSMTSTAKAIPSRSAGVQINFGQQNGSVYDRGPSTHASGTFTPPYYSVASGDTLYSIGQRFGVSWQSIAQVNRLQGTNLATGQRLLIPGAGGASQLPAQPPTGGVERVNFTPGATDATRRGVIQNGAPKRYVLGARAGQTLEIRAVSGGEPLIISVTMPNGALLRFQGVNNATDASGFVILPLNGDYTVTIRPTVLPESPSLNFTIAFVIL